MEFFSIPAFNIVGSRIDYCNVLLYGTSDKTIDKLQLAQNGLRRIVSDIGVRHQPALLSLLKELYTGCRSGAVLCSQQCAAGLTTSEHRTVFRHVVNRTHTVSNSAFPQRGPAVDFESPLPEGFQHLLLRCDLNNRFASVRSTINTKRRLFPVTFNDISAPYKFHVKL